MKDIKNKKTNDWLSAVLITIIIAIIGGCIGYILYLHDELNITTEKLAEIVEEKELLETQISDIQNDLTVANDKLRIADKEIDRQLEEIEELEKYKKELEDEELKWKRRYEEYPVATEAWIAMKEQGWSDTVCAGIMGNLMAETGGTTLNLVWDSNTSGGFGLVQWISNRRSAIKNKYGEYPTVKEQIQFIHDELYGEDGVRCQVTSNQLDVIMNAETPEDCAYAFACYYERCATQYRSIRKSFARKAYEYFTA